MEESKGKSRNDYFGKYITTKLDQLPETFQRIAKHEINNILFNVQNRAEQEYVQKQAIQKQQHVSQSRADQYQYEQYMIQQQQLGSNWSYFQNIYQHGNNQHFLNLSARQPTINRSPPVNPVRQEMNPLVQPGVQLSSSVDFSNCFKPTGEYSTSFILVFVCVCVCCGCFVCVFTFVDPCIFNIYICLLVFVVFVKNIF